EVLLLVRIGLQIVKLVSVLLPKIDEFVRRISHSQMSARVVISRVVVVAIIHRGAPVGGFFAMQNGDKRAALHIGGNSSVGEIEESRRDIDIEGREIGGRTR